MKNEEKKVTGVQTSEPFEVGQKLSFVDETGTICEGEVKSVTGEFVSSVPINWPTCSYVDDADMNTISGQLQEINERLKDKHPPGENIRDLVFQICESIQYMSHKMNALTYAMVGVIGIEKMQEILKEGDAIMDLVADLDQMDNK